MTDKIFNDPIHGHIEISALAVKVIDTPHFQRLRDISQLGGVYMVFPGAASNRFEHCLGVCYLARVFVQRLRENQPELMSDSDALCVEIAALCHDLGHGPFSHLYDGKFLPRMVGNHHFNHEHASIAILDLLIEENHLSSVFEQFGLGPEDIHFIKELILGDEKEAPKGFTWVGRGAGKEFLYDIVANKRNGIDVDKFDYFARDCHVLGLSKSFDALRLMKFARVFAVERDVLTGEQVQTTPNFSNLLHSPRIAPEQAGAQETRQTRVSTEICFHTKEAWNILELFHTRYTLHKRAYQHRVANAMELMICEVLCLADPYITVPSYASLSNEPETAAQAKFLRMSECPQDMRAYWRMSEYLFKTIEFSTMPELQAARDMIHRIRRRDLFGFAGETILTSQMMERLLENSGNSSAPVKHALDSVVKRQLWEMITDDVLSHTAALTYDDIFCFVIKIGYGKGNKNPLTTSTAFYAPDKSANSNTNSTSPAAAIRNNCSSTVSTTVWKLGSLPEDAVSRVIPREFEEVYIRVFTRHKAQQNYVQEVFTQWCNAQRVARSTVEH
jgi:HD superfamily phosphohydrolase